MVEPAPRGRRRWSVTALVPGHSAPQTRIDSDHVQICPQGLAEAVGLPAIYIAHPISLVKLRIPRN